MESKLHPFSAHLLQWYASNSRDLPWRLSRDPYAIWLSEIILQQTRIEQGTAYFFRFLSAFPHVGNLANAHEDEVLRLWQGLGYYSRARNLHKAAKIIQSDFQGSFPASYSDLLGLPGVGPYTAAAIASIAFDLPYAVVDGNVYRLLSRYFGIDTPIDSTAGIKQFAQLAQDLLPIGFAADYNQAMMDFGSLVCKPKNPTCEICPLADSCLALKQNTILRLPVKQGKIKIRKRFLIYLILKDEQENTLINKRDTGDIWAGLFQFPLFEGDSLKSLEEFTEIKELHLVLGHLDKQLTQVSPIIKHILSHQHLFVRFLHVSIRKLPLLEHTQSIAFSDLNTLAMPRLLTRYLEQS
jgi:A/G-specific adenine glycosylase